MSERIRAEHLARKAILYVRQSSTYQLFHNEESRRLQYGMKERLYALGWKEVEIVDDDLGRSAAGAVQRRGFERMVAEACLGRVGAIAAREVSRFARNSHDWQQLVEVCRVVDTLLIDHETVYDPRRGNDRLLLGVKGSLNEYELDILRLRSVEARTQKAKRGELIVACPIGYVKSEDNKIVKEPNRRVQKTIETIFSKFEEFGTARQVLLWFISNGLNLPARRRYLDKWDIVWKRPTYHAVLSVLQNPIYAGAYVYGRKEVKVEMKDGRFRKRSKRKERQDWTALIYDHHESYIEKQGFERIQEMISSNNLLRTGAAKEGAALLGGILRCGHCGRKLMVRYTGRSHDMQQYVCYRGNSDTGEARCIHAGGRALDDAVSEKVLWIVRPGAIEASRHAKDRETHKREDILSALKLDLQEARYSAERAKRQYDCSDPENRLVTSELECRWEKAMLRIRDLESRVEAEVCGREVSGDESAAIDPEQLTREISIIWNDPSTDIRLKKRIVRALIEEIVVEVMDSTRETRLLIHWKGGLHTELRVHRRRCGQNTLHTSQNIVDAVRDLSRICSDERIAAHLNRNHLLTGKGNRWTRELVTCLRSKRGIPCHCPRHQKEEGWLTLTDAANLVGLSSLALRHAVERNDIAGQHPLPFGPWILNRNNLKTPEAQKTVELIKRKAKSQGILPGPEQVTLF
jgi:DNA invertase Pin-like site-specific DNA recombinase